MRNFLILLLASLVFLAACKSSKLGAPAYDPPGSTDTRSKPIKYEPPRVFRVDGLSISNDFEGARLNDFQQVGPDAFEALILPENRPINESPWYAFAIWSDRPRDISLTLRYEEGKHRYWPKITGDMEVYEWLDSMKVSQDTLAGTLTMNIYVSEDPRIITAEELLSSATTYAWMNDLVQLPGIADTIIGYSTLGQEIRAITMGNPRAQKTLVLLGRQHPPEVSGFLCLQAFVGELLANEDKSEILLRDWRIELIPMINPDGIDLGHWRHNAGGVDLNRDWKNFYQPETQAVRDYLDGLVEKDSISIELGIDFHSTQIDLFYIYDSTLVSKLPYFGYRWSEAINESPAYPPSEVEASPMDTPSAKYYFWTKHQAEFITYENGDETPRDVIQRKAQQAAYLLKDMLINGY